MCPWVDFDSPILQWPNPSAEMNNLLLEMKKLYLYNDVSFYA